MNRIILIAAMLVAASSFVFGQSKDEQAIRLTLNELMTALNRNDVDTAGRIYANDYVIVLADGSTTTKAQRLGAMKSGDLRYQSLVFDNLKIRQYGKAAVANYRSTGKSISRAGEQAVNSQAMVMLVKNGGRWQVVSSQLTDNAASQSGAVDEKTMNQFMDDYLAALMKNSADAVEPFVGGQYIRVGPDGSTLNKEQALAALRSGDLKYDSVVSDERTWRTFGNETAIVTSRATLKASYKAQDVSGTYRATTVLRREGDRWAVVSTHLSPIAVK
ncbi:MAG: nuclear transport factor 2 family protein [Acidobacteriota bacterium]|nr:nuclear transport factor 2 family protein [Acidobacteriota bacterium]